MAYLAKEDEIHAHSDRTLSNFRDSNCYLNVLGQVVGEISRFKDEATSNGNGVEITAMEDILDLLTKLKRDILAKRDSEYKAAVSYYAKNYKQLEDPSNPPGTANMCRYSAPSPEEIRVKMQLSTRQQTLADPKNLQTVLDKLSGDMSHDNVAEAKKILKDLLQGMV